MLKQEVILLSTTINNLSNLLKGAKVEFVAGSYTVYLVEYLTTDFYRKSF